MQGQLMLKVKVLLGYIPTSNAKSLACDTANEHALTCTREACSCSSILVNTYCRIDVREKS